MNQSGRLHSLVSAFKLPEAILVGSFAAVILIGSLLLMLPWAQTGQVGFLEALFTSTSAVCVTGLIVVDTATAFTRFGQVIIMLLIQAGGLGIMTFAALTFQFLGRRMSLRSQAALQGTFFQQDIGVNFRRVFKQILWLTAVTEATGVVLLFLALMPRWDRPGEVLFSSIFHAVSAFCNAGFSVYTDSLIGLRHNPVFVGAIMALIVVGGLGHMVVHDLWQSCRNLLAGRRIPAGYLSTHSRLVLMVSAALIVVGAGGLLLLGLTAAESTPGSRAVAALFQSVTARTAGFNTVEIAALPLSSLLLLVILMFIGGSPASCAGGIKTTAFAISLAELRARSRGESEVRLLDRRIPKEILWRVAILIRLAVAWNVLGILFLLATEATRPGIGMHDVIFEQISAFGTVGLSTGLTEKLSVAGRIWIIATMFVGRLGPLTLAMWFFPSSQVHVQYPEGRIMIG